MISDFIFEEAQHRFDRTHGPFSQSTKGTPPDITDLIM
jgi:hypothetical protein